MSFWTSVVLLLTWPAMLQADEKFVKIQRVSGNQVAIVSDAPTGEGGPMRGGRGRRRGAAATETTILTVSPDTKITSAMRERRTSEFRVGAELAGGLQHRVFQEMKAPLSARIVTDGNRITEINVLIPETDINQSATTASGEAIIAVRPKRPPTKRSSAAGEAK